MPIKQTDISVTIFGMTTRKLKLDLNQLAVAIVNQATQSPPNQPGSEMKITEKLGRLGGLKGGKARADKLSQEQRSDIARMGALARWKKSN